MFNDTPEVAQRPQLPQPEALTPCCNAPFYAKTIRIGADGRIAQDGTPTAVRSCQACGANYEVEKPIFVIDSVEKAEWLLKKLAAIRGEQEKNTANAERVAANAERRNEELESDYRRLMDRFGADLENFARTESEKRRRKTITLLNGVLELRAIPARVVIEDVQTAMTTARAVAPDTIKTETVETFDKAGFLKFAAAKVKADGEILPGIALTEPGEKFNVKVSAG